MTVVERLVILMNWMDRQKLVQVTLVKPDPIRLRFARMSILKVPSSTLDDEDTTTDEEDETKRKTPKILRSSKTMKIPPENIEFDNPENILRTSEGFDGRT
ncbi:hypothetical protein RF11_09428 [Thelohanellus kitauei]|uniref:Uncharacterized protein n=1 Tax=Thelohanellus kitauei TaxID=669202 RepID=A0A0C2JVI7_THEKT|nr:hypothetical protein RF11_09428 [Thelohanellus kitauei]